MPTFVVEYYALLREERGVTQESVDSPALTPAALYDELRARHGFSLSRDALKVVVNEDFVEWDVPLSDGDTVVFIPPVAGG